MKNIEKNVKRLVFIKGFLTGAVLLWIIIGIYCGTYAITKHGQCFVQHSIIMDALKDHLCLDKPIPRNLSELSSLEYTNRGEKISLSPIISNQEARRAFRYYPEAWNKPGQILLQSKVCGSYVVTFGDGSRSTMSYWNYKPGETKPDDEYMSNEKYHLHSMGTFSTLPMFVLFILLILSLVILIIVDRLIRPKVNSS